MDSIEDIVKSHLNFTTSVSSAGWHTIYCELADCMDGSRTKGPRGGWNFSDDAAFYHCFNCGVNESFDPTREQPYSKRMWEVFEAFGFDKSDHQDIVKDYKLKTLGDYVKPKRKTIKVQTLDVPSYFYSLSDAAIDNVVAAKARSFLKEKKGITEDDYPFYLSNGLPSSAKEKNIAKMLTDRVIIPFFKDNKMVYYQARSLDKNTKKKYINADVPKTNIIYGFDNLYTNLDQYLFVCEGFFDAFHLNGVSVQENLLSSTQIDLLEKSPKQKVVVPDMFGDSYKLAEQAIELGWGISILEMGKCKDVTEAIVKYGKLATLYSITCNTKLAFKAKVALRMLQMNDN